MAAEEEVLTLKVQTKGAKEAAKDMGAVEKATEKANDAAEEYEDTLGDLAKETEVFGVSINGISSAFKGSVKAVKGSVSSLKAFKTALIATGVGAFVVVLGTLATAFASTSQGMALVEDVSSILANTWAVVIKRVGLLAKGLTEFFSGDFSKSFDTLGEAVSGFGTELAEAAAQGSELAQRERDLVKEKNALLVSQAAEIANLEKLRNFSDDVTQSLEDRIKATQKAREIIAKQSADNVAIAEKELQLFKDSNDLTNLSIEQQNELALLEAEASIKRGEAIATDTGELTKLNGFKDELAARDEERRQAAADAEALRIAKLEEDTAKELALIKKISDAKKAADAKAIKDAEATSAAKVKAAEEETALKLAAEQELFAGVASLSNNFAKAAAVAQNFVALRDTIAATISAFSETKGGIIVKLAAAATAAASGAALLSSLKAITVPKAADGMLVGNSHEQGGILIEAEGGEAIINKRSMAIPWVKQQASYLNELGGGVPFFARGGMVSTQEQDPFTNLQKSIESQRTVLVLDDLDTAQSNNAVTVSSSTL
jgi:hypothetical protein